MEIMNYSKVSMDKSMFNLYLKEIEFKSNNYKHNLYKILFVVAIKELF
jgi:hypothetical protein